MVTVTHDNVDLSYMNVNDWIRYGITDDALLISHNRWFNEGYCREYHANVVKNNIGMSCKAIKELNRW